jgi:hypothetical protein
LTILASVIEYLAEDETMNPIIGKCPVCGGELTVTRLECGHCGTDIGGRFTLQPLCRLSPEDLGFVEIFVKYRGNAYRVGEEMGMAYSAVRARLTEIIRALGYDTAAEPKEDPSIPAERRRAILDQLEQGKISSEEAVRQLQGAV